MPEPDHTTINNFRIGHRLGLNVLFEQGIDLCRCAGLVDLGEFSLDGSKIAANASKRKAMSYGRMVEAKSGIRTEIEFYFQRAAEEDAAEDREHGADRPGRTSPVKKTCGQRRSAGFWCSSRQTENSTGCRTARAPS